MTEITGTPEELKAYEEFTQAYGEFCVYVYDPLRSGGRTFLTREQIEKRGRLCADRAEVGFEKFRPIIAYFLKNTSPDFKAQDDVMTAIRNVKRCLDDFGLE